MHIVIHIIYIYCVCKYIYIGCVYKTITLELGNLVEFLKIFLHTKRT